MEQSRIRNFCIIAHIDHGKSTLADRFLETTGSVSPREMQEQFMDQMGLERERGITIKAKAVRMEYQALDGQIYELNLIDTPGHVDFSYEVSRSLAACEGAILVVDAAQGIQAQTIANVYLALEHDLSLIPVVNKIDLSAAEPEKVAKELQDALGFAEDEIIFASAKEGTGTRDILEAVVKRIKPPAGEAGYPLKALVFDSSYDPYKGALAYLRLFQGELRLGDTLHFMSTGSTGEALEVGVFKPALSPVGLLSVGEVGYVATGLKNARDCRVGDTITLADRPADTPLPGYRPLQPMIFAGLYPVEGSDYPVLREALDKLQLNDSALSFQPESSQALGSGFRCGFLGLLHMEIVMERLKREYGMELVATAPGVAYRVVRNDGVVMEVDNPTRLPPPDVIQIIKEPWLELNILTPSSYLGSIMELLAGRRSEFASMEYLDAVGVGGALSGSGVASRVVLKYRMPLVELLYDFYDQLKSVSQGYASLDYTFLDYVEAPLVKLDVLVNNQPVDALSFIVHRDRAYHQGKAIVARLRELIPRQLFDVPIQAAVGSRVIARETIKALRKNVLAKCYGGDVTRKRKLLEKQAEGKKRLKRIGQVEVPAEVFLALLKLER